MSLNANDHDLLAQPLRRTEWPEVAPTFGPSEWIDDATLQLAELESAIVDRLTTADRWGSCLTPDRYDDWRRAPARIRDVLIHAIDAEPATPLLLYWMLNHVARTASVTSTFRSAFDGIARVTVILPADMPARWRTLFRPLAPQFVSANYPAGQWQLLPHVAGFASRKTLVLDAVAAFDLVHAAITRAASPHRPVAATLEDGATLYRAVPRGTAAMALFPPQSAQNEPADHLAGPRLRNRAIASDERIGDGELTFHRVTRPPAVERSACIRCGWCLQACPTRCDPVALMQLSQTPHERPARRAGIDSCIDCGLCTAVCPSRLPLHGLIDDLRREIDSGASR